MGKYILSVDLGTTSMKTALFDEALKLVASAQAEYVTEYPQSGWAEQDPESWWDALASTTKEVLASSQIDPADIVAIGSDSMSSMALPLDKEGNALRKGLLWLDRRAEEESKWISYNHLALQMKINSNDTDPSNFGPKVMWMKNNEPEIYASAEVFLHCNGYLVYKLTGEYSMDISECGLTQICDIATGEWSDELIQAYGLDRAKFPPIFACTDVVGKVTKEAAAYTGLVEGIPVVAGAMDNVAACLGLGLRQHGQAYVSAGTATNAGACVSNLPSDSTMLNYHHAVPGLYLVNGGVDFGGAGLRWFKSLIEEESFEVINKLAEESSYDSDPLLFLPYMVGQRAPLWNTNSRAVAFGMNPDTDRGAMVRSIMEGNALGVRKIFSMIEERGFDVKEIVMTGGCANSEVWTQIFADILDKKIDIPGEMDVATLGSAMMAAVGVGLYADFDAALEGQKIRATYQADKDKTEYYNELFETFIDLYKVLCPLYEKLGSLRSRRQK